MSRSLSEEELKNNARLLQDARPEELVADRRGVLHLRKSWKGLLCRILNGISFANEPRLKKALELTEQFQNVHENLLVAELKKTISELSEELLHKDVIIETLQASVSATPVEPPPKAPEKPLPTAKTPPDFVVEEERAMHTALTAQEIRKIDKILVQMEKGEGEGEAHLPPPLELAREIGLASTGRTPRPSEEENLDTLKKMHERLLQLQERWKEREDQLKAQQGEGAANTPKGTGWLELDEAEVRELETTLGKVQLRNEQLLTENAQLKAELKKLKG